jgi:hypothetical protein
MGYEFGPQENEVISSLATTVKINGFAKLGSLLVAVLQTIVMVSSADEGSVAGARAIGGVIGLAIGGILPAIVMVWMFRSATAFRRIVDTQGDDIPNLIEALSYQRSFFSLLTWLLIIGLCCVGLACVFGMMVFGSFMSAMNR